MFNNSASSTSVRTAPCEVCAKLDGDLSPKLVEYCPTCKAWICARCQRDWTRRLQAAAIKSLGWLRPV